MDSTPPLDIEFVGTEGLPLLVFLHGWPDGPEVFDPLLAELRDAYRYAMVQLPDFESHSESRTWEFLQILSSLNASLPAGDFVLVGHDWGALPSYMFEFNYPHRLKALITLDVGPSVHPRLPQQAFLLVSYQLWLIVAYAAGHLIPQAGNAMTRWLARRADAPNPHLAHWGMNYLYWKLWRGLAMRQPLLPASYVPTAPLLFMFGGQKSLFFHDESWIHKITKYPCSKVVEISGGHWFPVSHARTTAAQMASWLKRIVLDEKS